jgi:NAD(P)-dependent dehydrogenase (short-subunit alcohol dehydrogenase family)
MGAATARLFAREGAKAVADLRSEASRSSSHQEAGGTASYIHLT